MWVRRDELQPRVAVRFSSAVKGGEEIDAVKIATILATLRCGVDRITHALADQMGMEREVLADMVAKAHETLGPIFDTATNVVRPQAREG